MFFVKARQVRTGLAQTASSGRWANCTLTSRAKMAGAVSRWLGSVEDLPEIAQRLLRVQIEHDDAIKVIQRCDTEQTLFYTIVIYWMICSRIGNVMNLPQKPSTP